MSLPKSKFFRTLYYLLSIFLLFLSRILKALWVFFPGILFVIFFMWCFWTLGQGKDLIIAFTENQQAKLFFCIAIVFWIYVSWYSSRIVAYLKQSKQEDRIRKIADGYTAAEVQKRLINVSYFDLPPGYINAFPRIIGFGCLLSIELAVLQSPLLGENAVSPGNAFWIFLAGIVISWGVDDIIKNFADRNRWLARIIFYCLLGLFIIAAVIVSTYSKGSIFLLFGLLLLLHIVFIFYINLRRKKVEQNEKEKIQKPRPFILTRLTYRIMNFLRVPHGEIGYFNFFNVVCIVGLIVYLFAIMKIHLSWQIGPFPFVLLAFGVLAGFGNIITSCSVKASVNFHFIIFLAALLLGSSETHYVRTYPFENHADYGIYKQRQDIYTYFNNWVKERGSMIDSTDSYPVYFVLANGGASRSGYWTASVLGKLEDTTSGTGVQFSKHVFCLSGTSGGGVGVATFFSQLYENNKSTPSGKVSYLNSAKSFLKNDFLTHTLAHMLGPDYFKYIFHVGGLSDRAGALEETFEEVARENRDSLRVPFDESFSKMLPLNSNPSYTLPVLCVNTTRMQDGNPGVFTNIRLDKNIFNNRVDVAGILNDSLDVKISTVAIMGARFPYLSPAGRDTGRTPCERRQYYCPLFCRRWLF